MKNLFKNLMLVAVAAMAFTACTETNDEVNAVVNKTRYEFTANIAEETRSGFAEKEEGATAYKSEWFGDETLKIFVTDYSSYNVQTTAEINAEGQFNLELENAPESFFITAVSPAESWASEYTATIPAEQTPLANSVDPKAHLLQAQAVPVSGNSGDINFTHMAAYGKMTVNNVAFAIDHVVVDLKGTFYGYDREYSYTINATHVKNNTFWFATEPIDVAEFTVTAYDAEGNAVTKTVDVAEVGKTMSFQYGRVGTFSVSGLEEYVAPAAPMFTSAAYNGNPGDKVVKLYSDTLGELWMNFYGSNSLLTSENWINPGQYGKGNGMYFGGNYGQYMPAGYSFFLTATPNSFTLDVSIVDGMYKFVINADYTNMYDGVVLENATFIGEIPGLGMPDSRVKLDTPSNFQGTAESNIITLSWNAVDGANGYLVKLTTPNSEYFEEIVTGTQYVYEAQRYSTEYEFSIKSYASDENADYRSSDETYTYVTTGKDPNMVPVVFTTCENIEYIPAQWRVSYNFSDGANNSMTLWLTTDHGATDTSLGSSHNYYNFSGTPGSVGNYNRFCPVDVVVNGVSKTVDGGNVQIDNLGLSWNVTMMLSFTDGTSQEFTYSGGVGIDNGGNDDGGDDNGEFTPDYTITSFSYVQMSTSYYTYQWRVSTSNGLTFNLYTPYSQGTELHEGTYTYYSGSGNTNGDFTFSTRMFSPAPSAGTMVVSKDGDTYTINLTVVVGSTTQKYQYVGTL